MPMIQYNHNFTKTFRNVNKHFFGYFSDTFNPSKYFNFYKRASNEKVIDFYIESQQFVVNLLYHIKKENGKNKWSRYFIDLTLLVCSYMDTDLRAHSIDNSRSHVDVSKFNLDEILRNMQWLNEKAKSENPNLVSIVVPSDFTLLYNVGDYILVGFDLSNKKFIKPKVFESKYRKEDNSSYRTDLWQEQKEREEKQKERMVELKIKYDAFTKIPRLNNFYAFPTYFIFKNKISNFFKKPELQEYKMDEIFSFYVIRDKKIRLTDKDCWLVEFIDEIYCGGVIPFIFRYGSFKDIDNMIKQDFHIFIKVRKSLFRDFLKKIDGVTSVDKHPSPYQAFVHFEGLSISVANIIHAKYKLEFLEITMKNLIQSMKKI